MRLSLATSSRLLGAGFLAGALSSVLVSLTACGTEMGICKRCEENAELAFRCYGTPGQGDIDFCMASEVLAELECFKMGGASFEQLDCSADDEAGFEEWPSGWPATEITEIRTGVFGVSPELEIALRDDWSLLLNDSARLVPDASDYFELENVAPTDLWALLGFETGDVFVRVNEHELAGVDGVVRAYEAIQTDRRLAIDFRREGRIHQIVVMLE